MTVWTAELGRRLDTHLVEVVQVLTGERGVREGRRIRFPGHGGLLVDPLTGRWRAYGPGVSGRHTIAVIVFLKACTFPEALEWATPYLAAHPGEGSCRLREPGDDDDDEFYRDVHRELCERVLANSSPITPESASGRHLEGVRLLRPPYNFDLIRHLEYARIGEHALVGILRARGRAVGVELLYVTGDGQKSLIRPQRAHYYRERVPGAVFEIAPARAVEPGAPRRRSICEGLIDGLTGQRLGRPEELISVPGIGMLGQLDPEPGAINIIVRDGDEPGSAADKALWRAIDQRIAAGETCLVTQTPLGEDVSSIWVKSHGRTARLSDLWASAAEAKMSAGGALRREIERLAGLAEDQFQAEVAAVARTLKVAVSYIRKEVRAEVRRRRLAELKEAEEDDDTGKFAPPAPKWIAPPPVLATLLSEIETAIDRYLVVKPAQRIAITLWLAASHMVFSQKVTLMVFPKLVFQSKDPESGKTTGMQIVWNLVPNGKFYTYPSGALLIRILGGTEKVGAPARRLGAGIFRAQGKAGGLGRHGDRMGPCRPARAHLQPLGR